MVWVLGGLTHMHARHVISLPVTCAVSADTPPCSKLLADVGCMYRCQEHRTPDIRLGMMHGYRRLQEFVASKQNSRHRGVAQHVEKGAVSLGTALSQLEIDNSKQNIPLQAPAHFECYPSVASCLNKRMMHVAMSSMNMINSELPFVWRELMAFIQQRWMSKLETPIGPEKACYRMFLS